jgi:outer membrane protein TolC
MMNRPDIQAAFLRIQAADASVKVAHRDLYPRFNLTTSLGKESSVLQDLMEGKATVWSLAGAVSGPILDGGNREAELGAANARAKQALASYHASLLSAFEEVENALGAEQFLKQQQSAHSASVEAAKKAEQRILLSFEKGLSGILNVLETQRRRFEAEERLISATNQRYQNRVALALALGKAY